MFGKLKSALVAVVLLALLIPAGAQAASTVDLPARGKLADGHVLLTVRYSCPATTSPEDALLWLYLSQQGPMLAAGDTAVTVTCDGRRHRYRAALGPNIGDAFAPGTVFAEAALGYGADTTHASDSAYIRVRQPRWQDAW
jgi:hypothetical protein